MKCPICGKEMILGNVERCGIGGYDNKYIFTPEEYCQGSGKLRKYLNKSESCIKVNILSETTAWHCKACKKIVMMADSEA